jgi:hypothetical protein
VLVGVAIVLATFVLRSPAAQPAERAPGEVAYSEAA